LSDSATWIDAKTGGSPAADTMEQMIMSEQKTDNGNFEGAAITQELGDDTLENVTGGRGESIGIFREPTHHPSKVFPPS